MSRQPTAPIARALLLACALLLAGCGTAGDLADDARAVVDDARSQVDGARDRLDDLARRADELGDRLTWCGAAGRLGSAVAARDADAAARAVEDLRAVAPEEILTEVGTIAEAIGRAQLGEPQALLDAEVQEAAGVVLDEARASCGVG